MSASSKKKLRKEQNAALLTEKQHKEQKEARKLKITSTIFVVVMVVVLVAALTIMAVSAVRSSGIIEKNTVALTVGEHEINAVEMNYFYSDAVSQLYNEWQEQYGDYTAVFLSTMGLDTTKPLNEQAYNGGETTWADHFLEQAIAQAKANYAMYDKAIAEGYTVSEELLETVDSSISTFDFYAAMNGYSTDDYLALTYGNGADVVSLKEYLEVTLLAADYIADHRDSLNYDDDAIRAYEADKFLDYSSYSYSSYYLGNSAFLPEDTGEDPTDAQVDAAVAEAKATAESLLTATTVEELDAAIAALDINVDNTTAASTLYTNELYPTIIESIRNWVSDDARKAGDIAVLPYEAAATTDSGEQVEKELGYYVVIFHSANDNTEPMGNVRHLLVEFETDESGAIVESSKAALKAEAEGYLADWKAGEATEDSFIALVQEYSDDSSASTGGLFEDINPDSPYVEPFLNWSIDPARKAGDAEVVETEFGYHVMYYVGDDELSYRDSMIISELTEADLEAWYNEIVDPVTVTEGNLSKVNMDLVLSVNQG